MGLKDTTTGDTLSDAGEPGRPGVDDVPGSRSSTVAIEPKTKARPGEAGHRPSSGSPRRTRPSGSARTRRPARPSSPAWASCTSRSWSTGMRREFRVEANVGKPQVAYRETITASVEKVDYTHKKQTGGSGQFARVDHQPRAARPRATATYEFVNKVTGGRIPARVHPVGGRRARRRPRSSASWPATRWWASKVTLRRRCLPRASTPRRWRSRSPVRWRSRRPPARPTRCCSSR